jgi:predicted amidohydrolase
MTKVALCQLNPISGKPEVNFKTIGKVMANKNADLYIFPEDFLHGIMRGKNDLLSAGKNFDYWINKLCLLAKKYKADLIPGSLPLIKAGELYNTTVYIDKRGKLVNQYSKNNLWLSERSDYSPSLKPPKVFNCVLGKTAQIICWDLYDHRLFEEAVRQGAEWIINVSLWSTNQTRDLKKERGEAKHKYRISVRRSERLHSLIETRSSEYNIGIMFCNFGGHHSYISKDGRIQLAKSAGSTQIITPLDGVRKITKNNKEKIYIYEVPNIGDYLSDHEIFYGRREDIKNGYPYSQQGSL